MLSSFFKSKKFIGTGILLGALSAVSLAVKAAPAKIDSTDVSDPARAAIVEDFPNARNLVWENGEEPDSYTAYFMEHRIRTVATVDRDGELLSVLKYYGPARLPEQVRSLAERQYPGKTIKEVTEYDLNIGDDPDTTYQVTLEDADHYYQVTIGSDGIEKKEILDKQ